MSTLQHIKMLTTSGSWKWGRSLVTKQRTDYWIRPFPLLDPPLASHTHTKKKNQKEKKESSSRGPYPTLPGAFLLSTAGEQRDQGWGKAVRLIVCLSANSDRKDLALELVADLLMESTINVEMVRSDVASPAEARWGFYWWIQINISIAAGLGKEGCAEKQSRRFIGCH